MVMSISLHFSKTSSILVWSSSSEDAQMMMSSTILAHHSWNSSTTLSLSAFHQSWEAQHPMGDLLNLHFPQGAKKVVSLADFSVSLIWK